MSIQQIRSKKIELSLISSLRDKALLAKSKKALKQCLPTCESFLSSRSLSVGKKAGQFCLSVTLCGNKKMQALNSDYRNKNKTTDVLSFPVHESLRESETPIFESMPLELGDIFICKDVAIKQAREFNISFEQEVIHLFVHGLLHLCGFDHEVSKSEEKIMFDLEKKLVKKIYQED